MEHLAQSFDLTDGFNVLRILCGAFLIPHLFVKFRSQPFVLAFMQKAGLTPPRLWLYGAFAVEIFASIGLIFAIYTPYFAVLAGVFLLVASWASWRESGGKWMWNFGGAEYPLFWAVCCFVVALESYGGTAAAGAASAARASQAAVAAEPAEPAEPGESAEPAEPAEPAESAEPAAAAPRAAAAAAAAAIAAPAGERIAAETARLNAWFEAKYEEQLDFSPMQKTTLGRKDDYDRIDDYSEQGGDAVFAWREASLAELERTFDDSLLTPEARISYQLWRYEVEQARAAREFRRRGYVFHQMRGPHTVLPQFLITRHRVDTESDMAAYVSRLGETARALTQALERARLAAAEGVHAPRFAIEAVIEQSREVISGAPFGDPAAAEPSPLWADALGKIDALQSAASIDEARADELRADVRAALREWIQPAYEAVIAWHESELPLTEAIATGVWRLPDGPAFYRERLASMTTTDLTAAAIHELGLDEVARLHAEMQAIMRQVGFDGDLPAFFDFVRDDSQFYLPDTDAGRQAYLDRARLHLDFIEARLPDYFGLLPRAALEVRRVEAFRERPGQAQHYQRGTPDGSQPGIYYSHLSDMSALPIPLMEVIAYHEGLPGHHMQISIAQELDGLPTFRRQYGETAYSEGWGLYSELLAKEMGAYADPYSDFGRLTSELWRAIRLVVDTGLHAEGWTEAEAVAYMSANSSISAGQIAEEIRRYIVMPGQATAYKIGMLRILELRERARAALGEAFDIRAFHDAVLGGGALPLELLEQRVGDWIAASL